MTQSPDVKAPAFADLDEAVAILRERGMRLSTSRRLVLDALFRAGTPVTADRVATELGLDLASVYRNLETFERQGLVRHVHFGHGPGLYMLSGRDDREYLFCEQCGAVRSLEPAQLEPVREQIRKLSGYEARFAHFAIVGRCPDCQRT
jgi:Fur family transcriptional regulator, ferric uptake regulator